MEYLDAARLHLLRRRGVFTRNFRNRPMVPLALLQLATAAAVGAAAAAEANTAAQQQQAIRERTEGIDKSTIPIPADKVGNEDYTSGYQDGYIKGYAAGLLDGGELFAEFGDLKYVHTKGKAFK